MKKKLIKSSIIIMVFSLIGRILGFVREMLIASEFGSNSETDAFFVAITATGLITALVTTAIRTILIPILSEVGVTEGKRGKIRQTNNILNIIIIVSIVFIIVGIFFAPLVIKVLAFGFKEKQHNLAVILMRIGIISLLFKAIVGVFRGYLQSEERFFESAISDASLNLVTIIFLIIFSSRYGIRGLMVATVLAVLSQLIVQIPGLLKTGYFYETYLNIRSRYIRKIYYLLPPVLFGVAVNDINKIIDRTLASRLSEGSISSLNYATKLEGLILSVFITTFITVLFPTLSKKATVNKLDEFRSIASAGINNILLITIPASMVMIVFSYPIVEIAFQRGEFDIIAAQMTSIALVYYSIGLVPISLNMFFNNIYYSVQDTKTPMIISGITVGFNVLLSLVFVKPMGHAGLAFATSLSSVISTLLLIYGLKQKIGLTFNLRKIIVKLLLLSTIIVSIAKSSYQYLIYLYPNGTFMKLTSLLISIGISSVIYILLLYILNVKEIRRMMGYIKNVLKK